MLRESRRLVSAALAVVLGVAFVAASLLLGDALRASVERTAAGAVGDAAVVLTATAEPGSILVGEDAVAAVGELDGVSGVRAVAETHFLQRLDDREEILPVRSTPQLSEDTVLVEGRLPQHPGEIAVNEAAVEARGLALEDRLTLAFESAEPVATPTVVGVLRPGPEVTALQTQPEGYAAAQDVFRWRGTPGYDTVYVDGADPAALRSAVGQLPPVRDTGATVRTGEEEIRYRVSGLAGDNQVLTGLLLSFAVVALVVAAMVVANTFAVLVAQRTRALALLRCVGATRAQVFRTVLGEALAVAVAGSLAGLALGAVLVAVLVLASRGTELALAPPGVNPVSVLVPLLAGVLVTVAAASLPARRATAVSPVAALRPAVGPVTAGRAGRTRIALGALAAAVGTAAVVAGAVQHQLFVGIGGGVLSAGGVLLLGPVLVPAVVGAVGVLPAGAAGLPGRLAVENARRHPARAAATAGALLVGVALITTMSVGALTGQASALRAIDQRLPVDAEVLGVDSLGEQTLDRIEEHPAVAAAARVLQGEAALSADGVGTSSWPVSGLGPEAADVVRVPEQLRGLADSTIVLPPGSGVPEGATVALGGPGRAVELTAVLGDDAFGSALVTAATLDRVDPGARDIAWVRFGDRQDPVTAQEELAADVAGLEPGMQVGGSAAERAEMQSVVSAVLLVVTGLLGVAVLIALLGIGNTLSLSVLERAREIGLLRALGLTRGQLRSMIGLEALVLAGVAVLLGLALGIGYGIAGSHALLGEDFDVVLSVPWTRLLAVAVVALAAGWLASVLPAARAARVSPAAALAAE